MARRSIRCATSVRLLQQTRAFSLHSYTEQCIFLKTALGKCAMKCKHFNRKCSKAYITTFFPLDVNCLSRAAICTSNRKNPHASGRSVSVAPAALRASWMCRRKSAATHNLSIAEQRRRSARRQPSAGAFGTQVRYAKRARRGTQRTQLFVSVIFVAFCFQSVSY